MKAARINQWNEPLEVGQQPEPTPGDGDVLVQVRAASVNPIDRGIALGHLASMYRLPMTAGTDFSGEVAAVGANVTHVKPGDAVFGMSLSRGTFAEYAVVNGAGVAHKPRTLDDVQAATVPLAGLTAWQTLFNLGKLKSGQRVLIHGAGGGVGSLAVQMAKNAGAYVIANERADKESFVKELGADEFVNSEAQRFEDVLDQVDVVLDLIGGEFVERSFNVIRPGGYFITTAAQLSDDAARGWDIHAASTFTQPTVEELEKLAAEIDTGQLRVFVNHTFPLDQAQTALFYQPQDDTPGNVVITIP